MNKDKIRYYVGCIFLLIVILYGVYIDQYREIQMRGRRLWMEETTRRIMEYEERSWDSVFHHNPQLKRPPDFPRLELINIPP